MEKNIIIGLAFDYNVEKIQNFVLSFRQYSNDIMLIISNNITEEFSNFLNDYNVRHIVYAPPEFDTISKQELSEVIMTVRWELPRNALETNFLDVENVILSDVKDVVFQDNPFNYLSGKDFDFSSEPETVGGCVEHNAVWIRNIYGDAVLDEIKDQQILCCGVIGGKRSAVIELCNMLLTESKNVHRYIDQASLNVLYGRGCFPNSKVHLTGEPFVATMHHSKTLTFDRQGYLLGDNGKRVAIVHQYDRCESMSIPFIKNALSLKGKEGIVRSAAHAVNLIPEWAFS